MGPRLLSEVSAISDSVIKHTVKLKHDLAEITSLNYIITLPVINAITFSVLLHYR